MALPQKVVDQLSREPVRTPGWSGQLLMFSSTIFFICLLVYFGLVYGYKPYLDREVGKLDQQIKIFEQQIPVDEQTKIVNFYSQLANLKSLLARHIVTSPLLGWLEGRTQTNVYFTKFHLNTQSSQLSLGGISKTIDDLTQQLQIFQEDQNVRRASFSNVSIGSNGLWQFDLTVVFDPKFLVAGGSSQ